MTAKTVVFSGGCLQRKALIEQRYFLLKKSDFTVFLAYNVLSLFESRAEHWLCSLPALDGLYRP
jgi:hypothetical protein